MATGYRTRYRLSATGYRFFLSVRSANSFHLNKASADTFKTEKRFNSILMIQNMFFYYIKNLIDLTEMCLHGTCSHNEGSSFNNLSCIYLRAMAKSRLCGILLIFFFRYLVQKY